jgi:hypothetical protein
MVMFLTVNVQSDTILTEPATACLIEVATGSTLTIFDVKLFHLDSRTLQQCIACIRENNNGKIMMGMFLTMMNIVKSFF